jgi:hypothetical protein
MYTYETEKPKLFTDDGQRLFLKIRDHVKNLLEEAGAFRMGKALDAEGVSGDSWQMLACVDRLLELGEIVECKHPNIDAGQNRIFTDGGWRP